MADLAQSPAYGTVWTYLIDPWRNAPWADVVDFWLRVVLEDRFVVVYCLPLLPVLLVCRRDRLRAAIVTAGLAFIAYFGGALYAALWLLTCFAFHRLGERFAYECRRTDVLKIGPPLAAIAIIGGWYVLMMLVHRASLPVPLNDWLCANVAWVFPLGARGLPWEPFWPRVAGPVDPGHFPGLIHAMFWEVHSIGIAYLAVRMLHYFSEIKRGTLPAERRTLLNFLAYTCYAPSLIQGPIERFAVFQDEMDTCHLRRRWANLVPGLARIVMGLGKSLIYAFYFIPLYWHQFGIGNPDPAIHNRFYGRPEQIESFWLLYLGVFLQIFGLYLAFSGYCDVSAGIARLLGYRQIENFKMPFLATSMRDFWRRWHISLSFILRDHVYIALGGNRRRVTLNLVITFLLCGLWHRLAVQVAVWGAVMGLMVAVNQRWVQWVKQLDESGTGTWARLRRGWLRLHPLPTLCAWLVTQHAFVFSLLIFFGGFGAVRVVGEILRRMWLALAGA